MRRQKEEKEEKREMLKISSLSYHATCNEAGTNLSKTSNFKKNYPYYKSAIFTLNIKAHLKNNSENASKRWFNEATDLNFLLIRKHFFSIDRLLHFIQHWDKVNIYLIIKKTTDNLPVNNSNRVNSLRKTGLEVESAQNP